MGRRQLDYLSAGSSRSQRSRAAPRSNLVRLKPSRDCLSPESPDPENTSLFKLKYYESQHCLLNLVHIYLTRLDSSRSLFRSKWSPDTQGFTNQNELNVLSGSQINASCSFQMKHDNALFKSICRLAHPIKNSVLGF